MAPCAERFGRKPKLDSEKPGSKIGVRTWRMACWTSLSTTFGMPRFLNEPSRPKTATPWYGFTPSRARLVSAIEQFLSHFGPLVSKALEENFQCDSIGARGPFVRLDFLPCLEHVAIVDDKFHELNWNWTVGFRCLVLKGRLICAETPKSTGLDGVASRRDGRARFCVFETVCGHDPWYLKLKLFGPSCLDWSSRVSATTSADFCWHDFGLPRVVLAFNRRDDLLPGTRNRSPQIRT